tara:strand:+ start:4565 stop:4753 length:189 start_codon:yes stop_codon:yes gene_type:complete
MFTEEQKKVFEKYGVDYPRKTPSPIVYFYDNDFRTWPEIQSRANLFWATASIPEKEMKIRGA